MNRRPKIPPVIVEVSRRIEEPRNQDVLLKRVVHWKTFFIVVLTFLAWCALAIAGFFIVVSFP